VIPPPLPEPLPGQLTEVVLNPLGGRHPHVHLHVVLELRRCPDRRALVGALAATLSDFPVLACRYRPGWWRDRWVPVEVDPADLVHVAVGETDPDAALHRHVERTFDHLTEPAVRLLLIERENGGARLVISVNHLVADGAGCLTLANVLGAHLHGTRPRWPVGAARSHLAVLRGLRPGDLPLLALEVVREGLQPWSILRVPRRDRPIPVEDAPPGPQWRTVHIQGEAASRFVAWCKSHRATINDGFVALLARLGAGRARRGPVAAAYTIDTRRYLARPRSLISNLLGIGMVVLPRRHLGDATDTLRAVSAKIGAQKRRLPGLAYNVLPSLSFGWLPHGLVRRVGDRAIHAILGYLSRSLAVTNIGPMDAYLEPFGDDVEAASVLGPFVHGLAAPPVVATGFRGSFTLHVCGGGEFPDAALEELAEELEALATDLPG